MAKATTPQPDWHALSHRERCKKLGEVRRRWCRRPVGRAEDLRDRTVVLDGAWIDDVPSFYLVLGEAINGPGGYFGGGLDALSDCLCGGFGVLPPLTLRLTHFDAVREALGRSHFEAIVAVLNERGAEIVPEPLSEPGPRRDSETR